MKSDRLSPKDRPGAQQNITTPQSGSGTASGEVTVKAPAGKGETKKGAEGFGAAEQLPVPKGGRFNPVRKGGAALSGIAGAMQGKIEPKGKLATIGVVMSPAASTDNPAADLFHHFRAGQSFIFSAGNQTERVHYAACKAAHSFTESPNAGPVRVITWSSANGWREVAPETGEPLNVTKDGRQPFNDKKLLEELYGKQEAGVVLDLLNPVEALKAVGGFAMAGTEEAPGRAVFIMNGLGPHLERSLESDARVYQQLVDMRSSLTTDKSFSHVVFNDGPNMVPTVAKELGAPYSMPLPTKRALEAVAFASIVNTLYMQRPADAEGRAPETIKDTEIAAWRKVVGDTLKDSVITGAIADGVTLESFERFLPKAKTFRELTEQLVGFTTNQAKDLIGEAISRAVDSSDKRIDFDFIADRRFAMLKENFNIELVKADPNMPKPQGLDAVIKRLTRIRAVFDKGHERDKPIQPAKMMLLAGVPGMGKSLVAKSAANILDKPLIKLDLARLFNKYVGESESNFARMFELLESLQPCVVWVDEIEKALGGTAEGAQSTDGGVTDRVHGLFLTWLEEHKERILLIGTCNEPGKLSAAMLNRTPVKYFVGYQDAEGLGSIWKSNLDAITDAHNLTAEQIAELVSTKPSLTGREVSQLVNEAREVALERADKKELITFADVKETLVGYTSEYEKSPLRAQAILQLSLAYESASGRPVFDPGTGSAVVVEERNLQAVDGGGTKAAGGRNRRSGMDDV